MRPDQDVELLGRMRVMSRQRGRVLRRFRTIPLPLRFQRPVGTFALREAGLGDLGFSFGKRFKRLGKGLRKVVKSKLFKYAAIGTAAYFTGGAALKYGMPALKKLAASRALRRAGKGVVSAAGDFAAAGAVPAYAPGPASAMSFPGLSPSSYGGGGASGGASYEPEPEATDESATPEEGATQPMLAGMGGNMPLLLGGGLVLAMLASGSKGGRHRRRRR